MSLYAPDSTSLRFDARRVSNGERCSQRQDSLTDQLVDLHILALRFGLNDAADWLKDAADFRVRYHHDYGEDAPA